MYIIPHALFLSAIVGLLLTTLKTVVVNRNTMEFMKEKGHDPNIAHPQTAIRAVSWNILCMNWFIAAAVGNYLYA